MLSDWIRAFRDPELLYKKLLLSADQLDGAARASAIAAAKGVKRYFSILRRFAIVVGIVILVQVWNYTTSADGSGRKQALVVAGAAAAALLLYLTVLITALDVLLNKTPLVRQAFAPFKASFMRSLQLPAWVMLGTIVLVVMLDRTADRRDIDTTGRALGIIAAFVLAAFVGIAVFPAAWLKRIVQIQLAVALLLFVANLKFPHVVAGASNTFTDYERQFSNGPSEIVLKPGEPDPPIFDPDAHEPRIFWLSRKDGSISLVNRIGFDSVTGAKYKPATEDAVETIRSEIGRRRAAVQDTEQKKQAAQAVQKQSDRAAPKALVVGPDAIPPLFRGNDRQPLVYFSRDERTLAFELYDGPGFDTRGRELKPATPENAEQLVAELERRRSQAAATRDEARRAEDTLRDETAQRKQLADAKNESDQQQTLRARLIAARAFPADAQRSRDTRVAVCVVTGKPETDAALSAAVCAALKRSGRRVSDAMFTPAFATDPIFDRVFDADAKTFETLELRSACDVLVLGRRSDRFTTHDDNASQGMVTDDARLDLRVIGTGGQGVLQRLDVSDQGAGFAKDSATKAATDRLTAAIPRQRFDVPASAGTK